MWLISEMHAHFLIFLYDSVKQINCRNYLHERHFLLQKETFYFNFILMFQQCSFSVTLKNHHKEYFLILLCFFNRNMTNVLFQGVYIYIYIHTHIHTSIYILEDPLEKEMAPHSSIFAWKISWTEEPGGLQSMRSHRQTHLNN